MFPSPRVECASVEHVIRDAGRDRVADVLVAQVEPVGEAVRLQRDARLERDLERRSRSSAFGGRWLISRPVGWLRQRDRRMPHRLGHAWRSAARRPRAGPRAALAAPTRARRARRRAGRATRRCGCRTRRRAGPGTARAARWRRRSPRAWRRSASASRPGTTPHARRVVADREVLVAELPRRRAPSRARDALPSDQVVWQCRSPRTSRELDELRRLAAERLPRAAPAGTTGGRAARRRPPRRARPAAARAPRRTRREPVARTSSVPNEAGGATRRARPARLRPSRRPRGALARDDRDDLGKPANALEHRPRAVGGTTTASSLRESHQRRGSPAATPPSAARSPGERARAARISPRRGRGRRARQRGAGSSPPSSARRPATSRSRPSSAAARSSSARRDAERAPELDRPLRRGRAGARSRRSAAARRARARAARRLARLDELPQSRSMPGPMPRSSRARPSVRAPRGRRRRRTRSAARRYARTRSPAPASSSSAAYASSVPAMSLLSTRLVSSHVGDRHSGRDCVKLVVLSGGVGGARFARGVAEVADPGAVTVVGNVGDDVEVLGMHVSPDLDSIVYALAGLNDEDRGWGRSDETWNTLDTVSALGGEDWFRLGDRDLGLHLVRTQALRAGEPLSAVTARIAAGLGSNRVCCLRRTTGCAPGSPRPRGSFRFRSGSSPADTATRPMPCVSRCGGREAGARRRRRDRGGRPAR